MRQRFLRNSDESFTTLLDAYSLLQATFTERVLIESLSGTFDPALPDHTNVGLTFSGTLMGDAASGDIMKGGSSPSGGGLTAPVGRWATP